MMTREEKIALLRENDAVKASAPPDRTREEKIALLMGSDTKIASMEGEVSAEEFAAVDEDSNDNWNTSEMQKGGAREFIGGMTLGASDEISAAVQAIPSLFTGDKSYGEKYNEVHGKINDEMDAFREAHGRDAALSNFGGSLIGMGGAVKGIGLANKGLAAGKKFVPSMLRKSKLLNSRAAKNIAVGAEFGGIHGGMTADQGERMKGAAHGAGLAGGVTGLLEGTMKVGKLGLGTIAKRHIKENLVDAAGNFTPIGMMEDAPPILKSLYNVVGKNFSPRYREQMAEKIRGKVTEAEGLEAKAAAMHEEQIIRKEIASDEIDVGLEDITHKLNVKSKELKSKLGNLNKEKTTKLKRANTAKNAEEKLKLEAEIEKIDSKVRKDLYKNSLPKEMTKEEVETILALPEQQAVKAIKKVWGERAFNSARRAEKIKINPKKFSAIINKEFKGTEYEQQIEGVVDLIETKIASKMKDGVLSGKDALVARNEIALQMRTMGKEGEQGLKRRAFGKIRSELDDQIAKSLPATERRLFRADLERYRNQKLMEEAAGSASAVKNKGKFGIKEVHSAIASKQTNAGIIGEGSSQKLADKSAAKILSAEEGSAAKIASRTEKMNDKIAGSNLKLTKAKAAADENAYNLRYPARRDAVLKKRALNKKLRDERADKFSPEALSAKELRTFTKKHDSVLNPNIFTQIASTRLVAMATYGSAFFFPATGGALISGSLAGSLVARKGFQKFLAGQAKTNEAARRLQKAISESFPPEKREEAIRAMYLAIQNKKDGGS